MDFAQGDGASSKDGGRHLEWWTSLRVTGPHRKTEDVTSSGGLPLRVTGPHRKTEDVTSSGGLPLRVTGPHQKTEDVTSSAVERYRALTE